MALNTHLSLITLVFHLVLPMTLCLAQASAPVEPSVYGNETVLRYYTVSILYGPNATAKPVAGIQGEFWSRTTFATIFVTDLPLVEGPSLYSQSVGQIQGLLVVASKGGRHNYETSSIMFNEYNGSTLVTQGTLERVSGEPSEVAVVGGTKQFRGAKGISTVQVIVKASYYTISRVTFWFSTPI